MRDDESALGGLRSAGGRDRRDSRPTHFPLPLTGIAERYGLVGAAQTRLAGLASALAFDETAPTTIRSPTRIRDDHLADSLVALSLPEVRAATSIVDLGSGPGLPGLPLAIALPTVRVTLLESNGHKCEFISGVAAELELGNVAVVHGRAETWQDGHEACDVVTARALAPLDVVAEYAAPLLTLGGHLVVWRGMRDPGAERDAGRAAEILGLAVREPVRVSPYRGAEHRHLHVFEKLLPTPARFPRRDGVARKRPLGRS